MTLTPNSILRKCKGVVSRSLDDARIALRLDGSETLVFNHAADCLWDLFDGRRTVGEVAAASGLEPSVVTDFAAQLVELNLFDCGVEPLPAIATATAAVATAVPVKLAATDLPQLIAREELAVLGGCTASGLLCSFPSSSLGQGQGQGKGPTKPPPGLNK